MVNMLIVFGIALLYVILFVIQRKIKCGKYFGFNEVIYGISNITVKTLLFKFLLIAIFSMIAFLLCKGQAIVVIGVFLGSFLQIWPAILQPVMIIDSRYLSRRKMLYTVYLFYILSATFIASLTISLYQYALPLIIHTISYKSPTDILLSLSGLIPSGGIYSWGSKKLNKPLIKEREQYNPISSKQIAATNEFVHHIKTPIPQRNIYVNYETEPNKVDRNTLTTVIESQIQDRIQKPVMGAERWYITNMIFFDNNICAVILEDGHIQTTVLMTYNPENYEFSIINNLVYE